MANWFTTTGLGKFVNVLLFGIPAIIDGLSSSKEQKFDDGSSASSPLDAFNVQNLSNTFDDVINSDDFVNGQEKSISDHIGELTNTSGLTGFIQALTNRITAGSLTGAEREQNAFNAEQAQIDRDFQERMASTQYQRGVADMQAAGVNPALAIGNGGAAAPSGAQATGNGSGVFNSLSDIMQMMMLKPTIEQMSTQNAVMRYDAETRRINAETQKGELGVHRDELGVHREQTDIQRRLMQNTIRLGDSELVLNEYQAALIAQSIDESKSRVSLQAVEKACKELDLKFSKEAYEKQLEVLQQEILYKMAERSNLAQISKYYKELTENAKTQGKILGDEEVAAALGAEWRKNHPAWAKFLDQAGIATDAIGNIFHFGINLGASRSTSHSDVDVRSTSHNTSHTYTHKGG